MTDLSLPKLSLPPTAAPTSGATRSLRNAATDPSANAASLAKAAQDFEAMALGELLQPMFDTVDTAHGLFGGGEAEAAWRPMLVQEMAKQVVRHGGLGLAQPVYAALLRMQQAKQE